MTQDKAHPTPPAVPSTIADFICRSVAELPDRNSPEDWPEAMLVTHAELRMIVDEALAVSNWGAAPVASNTTTEPAPIQPAGVEVERDAARYRWLRDQADPDEGHPHVTVHEQNDWGKWNNTWTTGETLDAAIDQALAAASQGDRGKT